MNQEFGGPDESQSGKRVEQCQLGARLRQHETSADYGLPIPREG
jgi:hypothetical protein